MITKTSKTARYAADAIGLLLACAILIQFDPLWFPGWAASLSRWILGNGITLLLIMTSLYVMYFYEQRRQYGRLGLYSRTKEQEEEH